MPLLGTNIVTPNVNYNKLENSGVGPSHLKSGPLHSLTVLVLDDVLIPPILLRDSSKRVGNEHNTAFKVAAWEACAEAKKDEFTGTVGNWRSRTIQKIPSTAVHEFK